MAALNDLAYLTAKTGVECELQCEKPVNFYDPTAATHLYRIAQEAVNNALKHSKAQRITLHLEDRNHWVELSVEDNGKGLPDSNAQKPGMGLQVVQHRASLIGGRVDIHSIAGEGVRVVCSIPKQR